LTNGKIVSKFNLKGSFCSMERGEYNEKFTFYNGRFDFHRWLSEV